jgi:hypothetical protein
MAEYLEQAIERLTRERFDNVSKIYFSKAGIAYREGMAARIGERLRQRRWDQQEEARAQRKAAEESGADRALTILDVEDAERDANLDAIHGEGYSARRRAERAAAQRRWDEDCKRMAAEEAQFKRDFPEEWAKREAEKAKRAEQEQKRWERNARRRTGNTRYKSWEPRHSSYYEGYEKGRDVSLDKQVDRTERKRLS